MRILDVAEVTSYLKLLLEEDPILSDVWIRGEVTNLMRSTAGHIYFSLAANGSILSCALFRGSQRGLLALPRNGERVLAHGRISVYESRGVYQLYVDNVAPEGVGELQLQFEELRRRLEAEGLFRTDRKRTLPAVPHTIGVVTSPTGAVWHDIQTVIRRRFPLVQLILAPSTVQGPDAPESLVAALNTLQHVDGVDVIIVARGGGSAEDLACFNDERLARAIFASRIPVVSAVGHETDVTIADLVADVRAPTPSAAAELVVPNQDDLRSVLESLLASAHATTLQRISDCRGPLLVAHGRIARRNPSSMIDRARQDVDALISRAETLALARIERARASVQQSRQNATHLDPRSILQRGYAIVTTTREPVRRVRSASEARAAGQLDLTYIDGTVRVRTNVSEH